MRLKDFNNTTYIKDFTKKCLMNESIYDFKGSIEIIKKYWVDSSSVSEFTKKVLDDERLINNQGYNELLKEQDYNTIRIYMIKNLESLLNEEKGDLFLSTISDIGCVSIGNDNFRFNIPNNIGDGDNLIYIFNRDIHLSFGKFLTTFKGGDIDLYSSDVGNTSCYKFKGDYFIYQYDEIFAFVKVK